MQNLKNKILQLKKTIALKEEGDKELREEFRKAITGVFSEKITPMDFVRGLYVQADKLVIVTDNKSFANEVFLTKYQLLESLKEKKIPVKDIVIKS